MAHQLSTYLKKHLKVNSTIGDRIVLLNFTALQHENMDRIMDEIGTPRSGVTQPAAPHNKYMDISIDTRQAACSVHGGLLIAVAGQACSSRLGRQEQARVAGATGNC